MTMQPLLNSDTVHFRSFASWNPKSRSHSLHKNNSISPLVGPHHKAHHCDNPCVNWWLGGYGIAITVSWSYSIPSELKRVVYTCFITCFMDAISIGFL